NQGESWGASSYAGNCQVFCRVTSFGVLENVEGIAYLPKTFQKGTSKTILFAEKYARCTRQLYPDGGNFWAYSLTGALAEPKHPGFAISWNASSIGPSSKFQFRPSPFVGNCDPTRVSTPHTTGQVCMADGHVCSIAPSVSGDVWWALCTPENGDDPGADW
ncbi:MAG TPA: hypothetical protein VG099_05745, partial [Gemmataceae bacterium]|nr:hypothetical protein [Gemmataceae bacterium]